MKTKIKKKLEQHSLMEYISLLNKNTIISTLYPVVRIALNTIINAINPLETNFICSYNIG
jgi:hypothetical protein